MIYLDYNATAPMLPAVREAMHALDGLALNPSSVHQAGRLAKKHIEDARQRIAQAISVFPNEIIFMGSGTEANNMVLRGFAQERALLVSAIEHASIHKTGDLLGAAHIPVDAQGVVQLDALKAQLLALGARKALVSVMLANNETGAIQPIREIVAIARAFDALVHVDAVQALGKAPLDCGILGADMFTLSGHKVGGPMGAAVLVVRDKTPVFPMLTGGGQELSRRAGTENVAAIMGLAELVTQVADCPQAIAWQGMRDGLQRELLAIAPDAQVFSAEAPRLPNTLQISMPEVSSETQLMHFDLAGFCVSAGSACSSGRIAPSHVLLAMGVTPDVARTAIRVSLGWQTTDADLDAFVQSWQQLYVRTRRNAA